MEYENRMSGPGGWKQQTMDSRGKPIHQPFSKPGTYDLSSHWKAEPITKHWRSALARRRLDLSVAERPLTATVKR
jgi:hypothetical protein